MKLYYSFPGEAVYPLKITGYHISGLVYSMCTSRKNVYRAYNNGVSLLIEVVQTPQKGWSIDKTHEVSLPYKTAEYTYLYIKEASNKKRNKNHDC